MIGKATKVEVLRDGKPMSFSVTVGRLAEDAAAKDASDKGKSEETPKDKAPDAPDAASAPVENLALGVKLQTLDAKLREKISAAEKVEGVAVIEADPKGAAAQHGVKAGDIIVEITNEKVSTPEDVASRIDAVRAGGRKTALLLLSDPKGEIRFVAVPLEAVTP